MPLPVVNVTIQAVDPTTNAPLVAAPVTARITVQDTYHGTIVARDTISGVTDAAGSCVLPLFPNDLGEVLDGESQHTAYAFVVKHPSTGKSVYKTVARVPNAAVNLLDIAGNVSSVTTAPSSTSGFRDGIVPSGAKDGANKDFTLPDPPKPTASLQLFLNGLLQSENIDYTLAGTTVSFLAAPVAADNIRAWYRY